MTNDIAEFSKYTDVFLLIGTNTSECHPIIAMHVLRGLERGAKLIVIDVKKTDMAKKADIFIQIPSGYNIPVLNSMINYIIQKDWIDKEFIQNYTHGFGWLKETVKTFDIENVAKEAKVNPELLKKAAEMYAKGNPSAILYTMGVTQFTDGTYGVMDVSNLALITGNIGKHGSGVNPLRGQNNVQGACDMGALPDVIPGSAKVFSEKAQKVAREIWGYKLNPKPGLKLSQAPHAIEEGKIKFLYIDGENPVMSDPWTEHFIEAIEHLDVLVVQDIFLTETAQRADVVLPAACWGEKDGTFINTSRKVQRVRKAVEPPSKDLEPDWKVICNIANRMGLKGFNFKDAEDVWNEIRKVDPFKWKGITYERIEKDGINWPCPDEDHPGTPCLYKDKKSFLPDGKFRLAPIYYTDDKEKRFTLEQSLREKFNIPDDYPAGVGCPSEIPDEIYPCMFTTGRKVFHYHTGTMTRRCKPLEHGADMLGATIELSPDIAEERGIETGDYVLVYNKRGKIAAKAVVNPDLRYGTIFTTFHYAEADGNELANPEDLDPISGMPPLKMSIANVKKLTFEEFIQIRKEILKELEPELPELTN